jgi:hypothetical protein
MPARPTGYSPPSTTYVEYPVTSLLHEALSVSSRGGENNPHEDHSNNMITRTPPIGGKKGELELRHH